MEEIKQDYDAMLAAGEGAVLPHVIFTLGNSRYAISGKYVLHIEMLTGVTHMVGMEENCRGITIFNDECVPVYDMKRMFGLPNFADELEVLMKQRLQDHENWVKALEDSVENGTPFTLTTDPHMCAFGKWYDSFHVDDSYLMMFMKGIERPHREVHKTGEKAMALMAEGKKREARQAVERMKENSFQEVKRILTQIPAVYRDTSKEMLIVMQVGEDVKSIVVDKINAIKVLDDLCDVPANMPEGRSAYIEAIAKDNRQGKEQDVIMMVDPHAL